MAGAAFGVMAVAIRVVTEAIGTARSPVVPTARNRTAKSLTKRSLIPSLVGVQRLVRNHHLLRRSRSVKRRHTANRNPAVSANLATNPMPPVSRRVIPSSTTPSSNLSGSPRRAQAEPKPRRLSEPRANVNPEPSFPVR